MLNKYLGNRHVLVCDPSSNFRSSIRQFLTNLKVKNITLASSTTDAKKSLLTTSVGLFLVEWIGDRQNGLEFCREIKRRTEHRMTPFLLMTSENLRQDVILASEGGVDRYLLKPFSYEDFVEKIHSVLLEAMDVNPMRLLLRQADAALDVDAIDEAEAFLTEAIAAGGESARSLEAMARVHLARKEIDKATSLAEKALEMNEDYIGAHKVMLRICETTGDKAGLRRETEILREISPDNPVYILRSATFHLEDRELDSAEKLFRRAVAISPSLAQAYRGLGDVATLKKDFPRAQRAYQKCLDLEPNDVSILNSLGRAYARMGKYAEGIKQYQIALRIDPKNAKITFNLGHALERSGDISGAETAYRKALKLEPDYDKATRGLRRIAAQPSAAS